MEAARVLKLRGHEPVIYEKKVQSDPLLLLINSGGIVLFLL